MVYDRYAVVHTLIYVGNVADLIDGVVVVDVGDLHNAYACVSHVDVLNIARASVIPRDINLSRPKREPSYRLRSDADTDTESCTADESY
jgi:hypothetical protein